MVFKLQIQIQITMAILRPEENGRCEEAAIMGR